MTDRELRIQTRIDNGELTQDEADEIEAEFGDAERDRELDRNEGD